MTATEAQLITQRIKEDVEQLWQLFLQAHEGGKAWEALGYTSWREYIETEFQMSESSSYRVLEQGRIILAFQAMPGGTPARGSPDISERGAERIKPHSPVSPGWFPLP